MKIVKMLMPYEDAEDVNGNECFSAGNVEAVK
jgi:hypothetical protein